MDTRTWLVSDLSKGNLKQVHKGDQIRCFNGRCQGRVDLLSHPSARDMGRMERSAPLFK